MFNMFDKNQKSEKQKGVLFNLVLTVEKEIDKLKLGDEYDRAERLPAWSQLTTGIIRYDRGDAATKENLISMKGNLTIVKDFYAKEKESNTVIASLSDLEKEIDNQISKFSNKPSSN